MFRKEKTFLRLDKDDLKTPSTKLHYRSASKEELDVVRAKVVHGRKIEFRILYCTFFVLIFLVVFGIYKLRQVVKEDQLQVARQIEEQTRVEMITKSKDYLFYIQDGDKWLAQNHWNNAIFQYKMALEVFPGDFDASYRLALAYVYSCKENPGNRDKAKLLIDKLLAANPNDEKLAELMKIYLKNRL